MAVDGANFRTLLTGVAGPGYTYPQPVPAASLGGYASHTPFTGDLLNGLFPPLSAEDWAAGRVDHLCLYVLNADAALTAFGVAFYLTGPTAGGAAWALGVDPTPLSYSNQDDPQLVATAASTAAPAGVTFTSPTDYAGAAALGDLPAGTGRGLWLRRAAQPGGAPPALDQVTLVGVNL